MCLFIVYVLSMISYNITYYLKFKADMKSYILMETAAIFFLANVYLKQNISEYVQYFMMSYHISQV